MNPLKKVLPLALCAAIIGCVDSEVSKDDLNEVNQDITSTETKLDTVDTGVRDNTAQITILEAAINELQEDFEALQESYDGLESEFNTLDFRVSAQLSQVGDNEDDIEALQSAQANFVTIAAINESHASLLEGFPDAIEIGSSSVVRQVFYILNSGEHSGQVTYWHPAEIGATEQNTITFQPNGSYAACTGSGCDGADQSISQYETSGDAFYFVQSAVE